MNIQPPTIGPQISKDLFRLEMKIYEHMLELLNIDPSMAGNYMLKYLHNHTSLLCNDKQVISLYYEFHHFRPHVLVRC